MGLSSAPSRPGHASSVLVHFQRLATLLETLCYYYMLILDGNVPHTCSAQGNSGQVKTCCIVQEQVKYLRHKVLAELPLFQKVGRCLVSPYLGALSQYSRLPS